MRDGKFVTEAVVVFIDVVVVIVVFVNTVADMVSVGVMMFSWCDDEVGIDAVVVDMVVVKVVKGSEGGWLPK